METQSESAMVSRNAFRGERGERRKAMETPVRRQRTPLEKTVVNAENAERQWRPSKHPKTKRTSRIRGERGERRKAMETYLVIVKTQSVSPCGERGERRKAMETETATLPPYSDNGGERGERRKAMETSNRHTSNSHPTPRVVNAENAERQWRLDAFKVRCSKAVDVVNAENAERQWRPVNQFRCHLINAS